MPLMLPPIDDRRFDALRGDALDLAAAHVPEWTNFNRSDPGVTLVEVFAFLTESLLYRANQIPRSMHLKFLQLLRIPLRSATAAQGLVTISNPSAAPLVLPDGLEVRAGQLPFRTTRGLDALPVEGRVFVKRVIQNPPPEVKEYYRQLYASFRGTPATTEAKLYEATPFPLRGGRAITLPEISDHGFWLALLAPTEAAVDSTREAIANRILTIGVVPALSEGSAELPAGRPFATQASGTMRVLRPFVAAPDGRLSDVLSERKAEWIDLSVRSESDVFTLPGVVDVTLPKADDLKLWTNIEPLEMGVGDLPPAIEDPRAAKRVVTWLRVVPSFQTRAGFLWLGINAVPVTQLTRVMNEALPEGNGEPDQTAQLAHAPVLPRTVRLLAIGGGKTVEWNEIDDLMAAGAEVPVPDLRKPPGSQKRKEAPSNVFVLDPESGQIRFGDGVHGVRPADGAVLRASYDYSAGAAGNIGANTDLKASTLPNSIKITNPVPTWGGADAESIADGEKQITSYLRHHDRVVTAADFVEITLRTPGVDIGRVEVLPNFKPAIGLEPVDRRAPGVVTLMIVPASDPEQPDAPVPRPPFLEAICRYLDPRRLVTTQIIVRGPSYHDIWVSIGIKPAPGRNEAQVIEEVKAAVLRFLAPTGGGRQQIPDDPAIVLAAASSGSNGWMLNKAVRAAEIEAVTNRTPGVEFVNGVFLGLADGSVSGVVQMSDLDLPRVRGISVTSGSPISIADLQHGVPIASGTGSATGDGTTDGSTDGSTDGTTNGATSAQFVQVPVIPEECR